jgi:hypothetical protein
LPRDKYPPSAKFNSRHPITIKKPSDNPLIHIPIKKPSNIIIMSPNTESQSQGFPSESVPSTPLSAGPPTYHEASSEATVPPYPSHLASNTKPAPRRKTQAELLKEFQEFHEQQNSNWGAQKGVVTGPAKDPAALFKWMGRKMSGDKGETSKERKARKQREWEEAMKESNGVSQGDVETYKIA